MSVLSLCDKISNIYASVPVNNNIGGYTIQTGIKYRNKRCRITQINSQETIANGLEKELPSDYRIYYPSQLDIKETDYIVINNVRYDVLYVDKCYKYHMQIEVKRNTNQFIENISYLLLSQDINGFITNSDNSLIVLDI